MKKKLTKWGAGLLAASLTMIPVAASASTSFTDVAKGSWYASYVQEFSKTKIINGYGDGRFGPNDSVSRAQFVQMLYNILGKPTVDTSQVGFSDAQGWYVPALAYATQHHLLDNFPVTTQFNGDQKLTRGEAALLLWNLLGYDNTRNVQPDTTKFPQYIKEVDGQGKTFTDSSSMSSYEQLPIGQLAANDIIHGYSDGSFRADQPITRAEISALLDTALRKVGYPLLLDPSVSVTQQNFIQSIYKVLSHASTMENKVTKFSSDYNNIGDPGYSNVSTPNGGGYTAEKVGLIPDDPNGRVTATQAAKWLAQWAKPARNVDLVNNVSSDPFTWAKINGWFEGTSVSGPNDIIQPEDLDTLNQNLKAWLIGYRLVGHTVYLHFPMVPLEPDFYILMHYPDPKVVNQVKSLAQKQQLFTREIQEYNQAKITIENGTATYVEQKVPNDRIFFSMGIPGDLKTIINAKDDFSDAFPIKSNFGKSINYCLLTGASSKFMESYGGPAGCSYLFHLDASSSVTSVEVGGGIYNNSIGPSDWNIITNYQLFSNTF